MDQAVLITELRNLLADAEEEIARLKGDIEEMRRQHAEEVREMQADFQREARDIAAEAADEIVLLRSKLETVEGQKKLLESEVRTLIRQENPHGRD